MTLVLTGPPATWKPQLEAADLQNVKRGVEYASPAPGIAVTRMGNGDWFYAVNTAAGNVTVTLPDVAEAAGQTHIVKRISGGANTCTITAAAGLLDGSATHSIAAQYGVRCYFSDGDEWRSTGSIAGSAGEVTSGVYTPTITNLANLDSTTASPCFFSRVIDIVTVAGRVTVDPTAAGVATSLGISLPIASNFANNNNCQGTAASVIVAGEAAAISSDSAADRAQMDWVTNSAASHNMRFLFMYQVL